jgi:hypothetical protein
MIAAAERAFVSVMRLTRFLHIFKKGWPPKLWIRGGGVETGRQAISQRRYFSKKARGRPLVMVTVHLFNDDISFGLLLSFSPCQPQRASHKED